MFSERLQTEIVFRLDVVECHRPVAVFKLHRDVALVVRVHDAANGNTEVPDLFCARLSA